MSMKKADLEKHIGKKPRAMAPGTAVDRGMAVSRREEGSRSQARAAGKTLRKK